MTNGPTLISISFPPVSRMHYMRHAIDAYIPVNQRWQPQIKHSKELKWLIKKGYLKQTRIGTRTNKQTHLIATPEGIKWYANQNRKAT